MKIIYYASTDKNASEYYWHIPAALMLPLDHSLILATKRYQETFWRIIKI